MKIILGGPGCGKTTALVSEVRRFLKECEPDEIGFIAFTRKAADEARDRCAQDLHLDPTDMVYFRTIHSFCFRQLGLNSGQVMQAADYKRIAHDIGLEVNKAIDPEYGLPTGTGDGDRIIFLEQLARSTGKTYEMLLSKNNCNVWQGRQYQAALKSYKSARGLIDFTDMIELFIKSGAAPQLRVLVVDEAQDLSALHWRVVDILAKRAKHLIIAGDDDQTIYRWAGADIAHFLGLQGDKTVLPISHRLPIAVFEAVNRILERISQRFEKTWRPRDAAGRVDNLDSLGHLAHFLDKGTWYCLARHVYLLPQYKRLIEREGYVYEYQGKSSTDNSDVRALIGWEKLRRGHSIDAKWAKLICRRLIDEIKAPTIERVFNLPDDKQINMKGLKEHGVRATPPWTHGLTIAKPEYYRACIQNGERLLSPPRIKLATIHAVKGGEADNVAILPDLSKKAYTGLMRKPDNEHRVFYVGASRAKERMFLLSGGGDLNYVF